MRIVYPLLWSRPDRKACRQQTMGTVAALARRGHDVTLLMPRGGADKPLTPSALRDYFDVKGDFKLVQRRSCWAGDALPRTLMWLGQVFRDPALAAADVLYSRIPVMIGIGARAPIPFVTDQYRPWPDDWPLLRSAVRRTARARNCLGLILHSDHAAQAYRRAGVDAENVLVAHNGYDPAPTGAPTQAEARIALGLPSDRRIAVYAGRINARKGLDQLFKLADLEPDTLFVFVGSEEDGPIEAQARRHPNVTIVGWQEPAALRCWLAAADVLLVPPSCAPLKQFRDCVLPLKLFAYLAAARPILAPSTPDIVELLHHEDNALLVPPGDPAAAANALRRILNDPALAERLSASAAATARLLTWDRRAERIEGFLSDRLRVAAAA